ncbi:MAG TPA: hypothetical protein EYN91_10740 [Candidatus Melainabacteria bacterium]|jgi:hypothetical protein|nr:hypothetical protein [Candidatus Obscuribacterales bacterium]HIA52550.1 hypothetical protein [Candidatus Melainabacteria bacterium]HIN64087.1 hypothetical protein [Candidatus Obscuribacterales bacterium]
MANSSDWFDKLTKKLASEPRCTDEEQEAFEAERKVMEGTQWEWAQMQTNGDISVRTTQHAKGGQHGIGDFVVSPDDAGYEEAKQYYGLSKPGDTYHLQQKWIDGKWVTELEERPEQRPADGKAKSA